MNNQQFTVLVIPSCNEPGLEIVQSLRFNNKFRVIAASSISASCDPSVELAHKHLTLPWLNDPTFEEAFYEALDTNNVDLVFPATDSLVQFLAERTHPKARFVVPCPETANIVASKTATYETLGGHIKVPKVFSEWPCPLPAFAKPDRGSGARGTMKVTSKWEFDFAKMQGLVITEYLPGQEFTVDCLSSLDGDLLFCNPRLRAKVDRGIAVATWSVEDSEIRRAVEVIAQKLKFRGPWFAQFKLDERGRPCLMEVNARVGGSMTLSRLQGVNIPLISAFMFLGFPVRIPRPMTEVWLKRRLCNIAVLRGIVCAIWDIDDTLVMQNGNLLPSALAALVCLHNRGVTQLVVSKNVRAREVVDEKGLAYYFREVCVTADKRAALEMVLERYGLKPEECVMINDSNTEKLELLSAFPGLKWVTPDALDLLMHYD